MYGIAASFLIVAVVANNRLDVEIPLVIAGLILGLVSACFHHLTITDEGDSLRIKFGPLPLFQRRVWYRDIQSVEVNRTRFFDGWGVHLSIRGGWVWNIWGKDCVLIKLTRNRKLWLGNDEPNELCEFLKGQIAERG